MKKQLITLFLLISVGLTGQNAPNWLRYPTISPDGSTIVFTYKGDLYKVSANGGDATQLTFHESHDYMAVWSNDGKKIAFASDRYGNFDIYAMDAKAVRQSPDFPCNSEQPFCFSADGKSVLFGAQRQDIASHRQYPHGSQPELYSVPVEGGAVQQVLTIPAEYVQVRADGKQMIYHDKKGGENEFRKHHTSAITRDIWAYDVESDQHKMITSFARRRPTPSLCARRPIYFLFERREWKFQRTQIGFIQSNQKDTADEV